MRMPSVSVARVAVLLLCTVSTVGAQNLSDVAVSASDCKSLELLSDGSFEGGTPNPFWDEASTNWGTPINSSFSGHTGDWACWFHGHPNEELGSVSQTFEAADGHALLTYWYRINADNDPRPENYLKLFVDGAEVAHHPAVGNTGPYRQEAVRLSQLAPGVHELRVEAYFSTATAGVDVLVDDVSIMVSDCVPSTGLGDTTCFFAGTRPADGGRGVSVTPVLAWQCVEILSDTTPILYRAQVRTVGGSWQTVCETSSTSCISALELMPRTTYEWQVLAYDPEFVTPGNEVCASAPLRFTTGEPPTPRPETPVSPPESEVAPQTGSATDRRGNRVVVWQQTGGRVKDLAGNLMVTQAGDGVFGRYFDPDDDPVGDVIEVDTAVSASMPTVSFDGSGNFVIGWERGIDGVFGRYFGSDLAPLTGTFQVDEGVGVDAESPRVATASAGDFVMAWRGSTTKQVGDGVFGRFFNPDGAPKGDAVQVDEGGVDAVSSPAVATDASGNAVVVWAQEASAKQAGDGVFGRYFDPEGSPQGDPFQVNDDLAGVTSDPRVGAGVGGEVVVVWAQDTGQGTGWDVFGRLIGPDGVFLGQQFTINTVAEGDQAAPSVGVNPAGDFTVAWESGSDGIFGRFFTAGGLPLGPQFAMVESEGGLVPSAPEVSVAGDDTVTVSYTKIDSEGVGQGVFFTSFEVEAAAGECDQDATTNCLNQGRFEVRVSWKDFQGNTGSGQAVALTDDTGYFWYFDDTNVELMLKVLDATGINNHFWVFYGALSNVEYTIVVTDTQTGSSRAYFNPSGTFASVGDTEALPSAGKAVHGVVDVPPQQWPGAATESFDAAAKTLACTPGPTNLCLNASRFEVEVEWEDFQGNTGVGQAVPLTADTGYFWFFDSANVELVLKVLDARGINHHFWVFYGALSNVAYTITVTDTETGAIKRYGNPADEFGSVGDTEAFFVP